MCITLQSSQGAFRKASELQQTGHEKNKESCEQMVRPLQSPDSGFLESVWDYAGNQRRLRQTKSLVNSGLGWHFYSKPCPQDMEQPAQTMCQAANESCCFGDYTQSFTLFYMVTPVCLHLINKNIFKSSQFLLEFLQRTGLYSKLLHLLHMQSVWQSTYSVQSSINKSEK